MMKFRCILAFFILFCVASIAVSAQQTGKGMTLMADRPVAPELALLDLTGGRHRLADYQGQVVIVNFWATWCPPCREEMPSMQRAWETLRSEGVVLLAVDVGEKRKRVADFVARENIGFPVLLDERAEVFSGWPMQGLPTTFIVDGEGRLVYRASGGREWDDAELMRMIRELIP